VVILKLGIYCKYRQQIWRWKNNLQLCPLWSTRYSTRG